MFSLKKVLLAYLSYLLFSSVVYAQFRDPTQPAHMNAQEVGKQIDNGAVLLSAIWHSAHSSRATLNGKTLKLGQSLNGIKLLKVKKNSVLISNQGLIQSLYLIPATYKNAVINLSK